MELIRLCRYAWSHSSCCSVGQSSSYFVSMSSEDGKPREGAGLGHSTPLVTISGPAAITHGVAVPAGDNHPLAAMAPPVAPQGNTGPGGSSGRNASESGINRNRPSGPASAPVPMIAKNLSPTFSPPPMSTPPRSAAPSSVPSARVVSASVSPTKSLESLADQFLSVPSSRTDKFGLAPLVRPLPLPHEDAINRLRTLVDRRAWGDVLKIATTMLTEPDPHSAVYSSLIQWPAANNNTIEESSSSTQLQQETVEILSLKCHAWLKLRRYADLATEVERWNFVTNNDATAESPAWLPWSLRKCRFIRRMHNISWHTNSGKTNICLNFKNSLILSFHTIHRYHSGANAAIFRRSCQF